MCCKINAYRFLFFFETASPKVYMPLRLAVAVTLIFNETTRINNDHCYMPLLCSDVGRLSKGLNLTVDVLVMTDFTDITSLCPSAKRVMVDRELKRLSTDFIRSVRMRPAICGSRRCKSHLGAEIGATRWILRWSFLKMTEYDAILVMDADASVEGMDPTLFDENMRAFLLSDFMLSASSDHESPVQAGSFVVRPSISRYEQGLALMRTRRFEVTGRNDRGFNASVYPMDLFSETQRRRYRHTWMLRQNSWNFVAGHSDQGLLVRVFADRLSKATRKVTVRHYWSGSKPHLCQRFVERSMATKNAACQQRFKNWNTRNLKLNRTACRYHLQSIF